MINNPNAVPGSETPNGAAPTGETPTLATGETPGTTTEPSPAEIRKENERLSAALKRANAEAKEHRLKAEELDKIKEARMREQGEYEQLAKKHEERVKELEPISERYNRLAEQVRTQILADTKQWPAEVKAFYPGDDADVEQLQDWFTRSKPLVAKLTTQAQPKPAAGNGPNPRPISPGQQQVADVEELRRRARESGKYAF